MLAKESRQGRSGIGRNKLPAQEDTTFLQMVVRIGFARFGVRNKPFYRIMVQDSRKKPTGKFIEQIGTFNPIKNAVLHLIL